LADLTLDWLGFRHRGFLAAARNDHAREMRTAYASKFPIARHDGERFNPGLGD
jgi:hypothetical protein